MTPGSERDLIPVISRIGRQARNMNEAIALFQPLLAGKIGDATLLVDPVGEGMSPSVAKSTAAFLDSRQFPFRGLYTAPLTVANRQVGRLIACFGSFGMADKSLPAITSHVARQLSEILARTGRSLTALTVSDSTMAKEGA